MATAGNDDRLYVFEAFGILLGIDDVPEAAQVRWLEAAVAPLRAQVEAAAARGAFPGDAAAAQHAIVALGNIAKGFPLRMATVVGALAMHPILTPRTLLQALDA
jgi:exportin-T